MDTEEKIVYSIINTVKKQKNDDSQIGERLIRGFVQSYRAAMLADFVYRGVEIPDECFQTVYGVAFDVIATQQFIYTLPKVVRLKNNTGIIFSKNGYNIPVLNSEEYDLGRNHHINKYTPKAKVLGNRATVYIGKMKEGCFPAEELNQVISDFDADRMATNGRNIFVDISCVYMNPDEDENYDWTRDPFPMPAELTVDIENAILRDKFNIILQTKEDRVTDGKDEPT